MVVASPNSIREEKVLPIELPVVDLSAERTMVMKLIVKACEEYGFFNVINHGVPHDTISKMEEAGFDFFAKPMAQKKKSSIAGNNNPFGYGCKNIGINGDMGEVEYLLLNANNNNAPSNSIAGPSNFRYVHTFRTLFLFFLSNVIVQYFCIYCMFGLLHHLSPLVF